MSKASETAMESLHGAIAKALSDIVEKGITVLNKEGEAVTLSAPAAYLKEAREFLKDNGMVSLPGTNKAVNSLASKLPFPAAGEEDFAEIRH